MTNQLSSFRRFPTAFAIVAGSALAFGGLIASTSPAYAQGSADYRCTGRNVQEEAYCSSYCRRRRRRYPIFDIHAASSAAS